MRITFVLAGANLSGGVRVVQIYGSRLSARGHDIVVVSVPPSVPRLRGRIASLLRGRGWPRMPEREPSHLDGSGLEHRILDRFRDVADADVPDADVVIATFWRTAAPVARLSSRKGAKAYFMQDYGAPGMELADLVPTWSLGLHLITIARWLVDLIHAHCGPLPVSLVPNGVDTRIFHAAPRPRQKTPTIGFLYREEHVKGADLVLDAFRLARRELPDLRLAMFGPERPTRALPEGAEFRFRPDDEEVRRIYTGCDAWIFASRREGFGLPLLEAMACRTPVIATPAGAAPELLARGAGVMVPHEDPAAMAEAVTRVCTMAPDEWRLLSDAAHATAASHSWEDSTDRFEAALREAVGRGARAAGAGTR